MTSENAPFLTKTKRWVNLARSYLLSLNPDGWYFLSTRAQIALVAGTAIYALPADFDRLETGSVFMNSASLRARLTYAQDKDIDLLNPTPATTGSPVAYLLHAYQAITVLPTPSTAFMSGGVDLFYTYFKNALADMSADANTSGIPQKFEPLMLDIAEIYASNYTRNMERSNAALERALGAIKVLLPNNTQAVHMVSKLVAPAQFTDLQQQETRVDRT